MMQRVACAACRAPIRRLSGLLALVLATTWPVSQALSAGNGAAGAVSAAPLAGAAPATLSYELDLSQPDTGAVTVTLGVRSPGSSDLELRLPPGKAVTLDGFRVLDENGRPLAVDVGDQSITVADPPSGGFQVHYTARPGGFGRHGRQGYVGTKFAVFDGRVLLLPRRLADFGQVRFRFTTPRDWRVITSYEMDSEGWYRLAIDTDTGVGVELLRTTCLGAGRFEVASRRFGATEVAVHVFAGWPEAHRTAVIDKTFRLYGYFHERFGLAPWPRFAVAWTPYSADRHRIFGGVSAISSCYEMARDRPRNWAVMAHRIAHAINRLPPSGMVLSRDDDDLWFSEGWASYQEIVATAAAGLVEDERGWNALYRYYLDEITVNPGWDIALAREDELDARGREHLHYRKSALVMKLLEVHLRERGVDLQGYVADAYARHRERKGVLRFRADLESWAGLSLDDFWDRHVRRPGVIVPVWPEAVTPEVEARMVDPPALRIGAVAFHPDYLFHLAHRGGFPGYGELVAYLKASAQRRRQAESLYPEFLNRHRFGLPARAQRQMDRYEQQLLAAPPPAAAGSRIRPDATLARLLDAEDTGGASPVNAAAGVRILSQSRLYDREPVERLAVRHHEALFLDVPARSRPVAVALIDPEGDLVGRHEWTPDGRPWRFPAPDGGQRLLEREGLYSLRIQAGDEPAMDHLLWVRDMGPPSRP